MDNNKLINLEEARNILNFAKRVRPLLNGLTVEYGDVFAYYPSELKITIPEEFDDVEVGMNILEHVNEEFGAEFKYNLREMSIQALLHECGHHLDFEGKIMTNQIEGYMEADCINRGIYEDINKQFSNKVNAYLERLEQYEALDVVDRDIEFELEQNRIELAQEDYEIDMLYRMIPTEYAADEFSARFFMTYLRGYRACNFDI
jgi:hypothetical protein